MNRVFPRPNGAGGSHHPAMVLLTEQELARQQMEQAAAAVTAADAAVTAVDVAWQRAQETRRQATAAYHAYQQAQATETCIAELKFRFLGALLLLVATLGLAMIQVSLQSFTVVMLVFSLPLALYAWAKARQLRKLHAPRSVSQLEREYQAWARRDQEAQADYLRKRAGYAQLFARHQRAVARLNSWQREFRRCQQLVEAQQRAEQRANQFQP